MAMSSMEITAPGKLFGLIIAMVLCFASILAGQLGFGDTPDIIPGVLFGIIGYLLGNGVGARTGQPTAPVIGPKTEG